MCAPYDDLAVPLLALCLYFLRLPFHVRRGRPSSLNRDQGSRRPGKHVFQRENVTAPDRFGQHGRGDAADRSAIRGTAALNEQKSTRVWSLAN